MKIELRDLQFYLLNGSEAPHEYMKIYDETYQTWRQVWEQAFLELNGNKVLYSDGFTRQTKIGAIFYRDRCVSLIALRECDFSFLSHKQDPLLSSWDTESFEKLVKDGSKVAICSYLSVHPDFRGEIAPGISLKLLISFMSVRTLLDSDCDVMTGTTRCNRGTDKAAYSTGATFLKKSSMHGVEVDLIAIYRRHVQANLSKFSHLWAEALWSNRIDLLPKTLRTPAKKAA